MLFSNRRPWLDAVQLNKLEKAAVPKMFKQRQSLLNVDYLFVLRLKRPEVCFRIRVSCFYGAVHSTLNIFRCIFSFFFL